MSVCCRWRTVCGPPSSRQPWRRTGGAGVGVLGRAVCLCASDAGRAAAAVVMVRFDEALCAIRAEHELWQDEASTTSTQDQDQQAGGGGGGAARGGMQQARWGGS